MPARILAFGEIIWDVFDESACLGGAPLNFALHARRLGHEALLVSAVGNDELGVSARAELRRMGMDSSFVQCTDLYPTGSAEVRGEEDGRVRFLIQRPAAYDDVRISEQDLQRLVRWDPRWLYYGTLSSMAGSSRALLARLAGALPRARGFYDVNLRKDSYTPELVAELLERAAVVKMNQEEMEALSGMFALPQAVIEEFCRAGAARFGWQAVAVTLGERGCAIWVEGACAEVEGVRVAVADTVGAGDAFAAAFVHGLSLGWPPQEIGEFANRLGALIASRQGGTPDWSLEEIEQHRA